MLATLIGLYEASVDCVRADFPEDRPAQIAGDARLARCLTACLSDWYQWTSPLWPHPASAAEAAALATSQLDSPSALRLALYDHVNATYGGFLTADDREPALDEFTGSLGLSRATLDALLALDAPGAARLVRLSDLAPTPLELATRYNQRAAETLLMNASDVTWRLDAGENAALGAIVKRMCFLARKMGVSYEVNFDDAGSADTRLVAERRGGYAVPTTLERARLPVLVTLHGPREIMGPANQYGERLSRLCRALLGYRRDIPAEAALGDIAALSGVATIHLRGRPCKFALDERLTRLLRLDTASNAAAAGNGAAHFDSSLERRLHADFAALERAGESAGWRLEREPEPVILGDTILVPDFALTRENRRVYLEVAGYWRPDYRARKAHKLAALRGAVALIVAAPESARAEFAGLDASYPFLWYRQDAISAPALVAAIERAYDDFPDRLAALDFPHLLAEVERRGVIPSAEASAALRCYTRAEMTRAVRELAGVAERQRVSPPEWIEGMGLCAAATLDQVAETASATVAAAGGRLALSELTAHLSAETPLDEAVVEALALRAGLRIERASLFAASVFLPETEPSEEAEPGAHTDFAPQDPPHKAQPRKPVRRTHSGAGWKASALFPAEDSVAGSEPAQDSSPAPSRENNSPRAR
jgi:predicted nuclease of restriction endonuclease-like RecB superfamily